ncbi:hypothetical protein LOTGIDRAFT_116834 [Lottia gigantea]|uniref:SCP domain-containing protein n=1 Tax=Lottia gigantea TaxID=225164 RepID=V4AL52_LOTGI|nr:hypothetical protein LOTGIDRAFT_116834 [Lottia gigantea]ESO95480.1 hypothetical protein LOTGIDRAFT_116834 [Lottia gigantea]
MCLVDVGTEVPLTQAEKDGALTAHNDYRKNVSPKATNMQKMVWDDELATIATKWAQQCRSGHDAGKSRKTIYTYVGQNMAAGYSDLNAAIKGWHDEVVDYQFGVGSINGKAVGHYTQVVQHMSSRVGCGKANCPNTPYGTYYICNYATGQGSINFPYKNGTSSCSDCPTSCKDNLCGKL